MHRGSRGAIGGPPNFPNTHTQGTHTPLPSVHPPAHPLVDLHSTPTSLSITSHTRSVVRAPRPGKGALGERGSPSFSVSPLLLDQQGHGVRKAWGSGQGPTGQNLCNSGGRTKDWVSSFPWESGLARGRHAVQKRLWTPDLLSRPTPTPIPTSTPGLENRPCRPTSCSSDTLPAKSLMGALNNIYLPSSSHSATKYSN